MLGPWLQAPTCLFPGTGSFCLTSQIPCGHLSLIFIPICRNRYDDVADGYRCEGV